MYIEAAAIGDVQEGVVLLCVLCKYSSDQIYTDSLRKGQGSTSSRSFYCFQKFSWIDLDLLHDTLHKPEESQGHVFGEFIEQIYFYFQNREHSHLSH